MNDDRLRTALLDLSDVSPPPDLAGSALTRARRDRRRTATGLIAGVAVLATVAVTVPVLVLGRPAPAETATGGTGRVIVTGYAAAASSPNADRNEYRVYDRSSGRYVTTPWRSAVPSPDGRLVLVTGWGPQRTDTVGIVPADRVLDRTAVRWISDGRRHPGQVRPPIGPGVWSPDSTRVLALAYSTLVGGAKNRYVSHLDVFDARTLAAREVVLTTPVGGIKQTFGTMQWVFGPRGHGFAALEAGVMTLYNEQGRPAGQLPAEEVHDQPFSPDGSLIGVGTVTDLPQSRVLGVPGGAEVGRVDGEVIGWLDDRRCVTQTSGSVLVVELGSGRVVAERRLIPANRGLIAVWVAPLAGSAPPGAIVL